MGTEIEQSRFHNTMRTAGAIAGASAAGAATFLGTAYLTNKPAADAAKKAIKGVMPINSVFKAGAQKALEMHNIKHYDTSDPFAIFAVMLHEAFSAGTPSKFQQKIVLPIKKGADSIKKKLMPEKLKEFASEKINKKISRASEGINASCLKDNVLINLDKASALTFHEMGHAMNYRSKGLGKVLQALRHPAIRKIGLGIAFASAILIPSKVDSDSNAQQEQGFGTKIQRFLKKNCVGIAAVTVAPEIMEEGLASIKGAQIAKSVLDKDACKIVNKLNGKAFLSYLAVGVAWTLGVFAAKKVRECIDTE